MADRTRQPESRCRPHEAAALAVESQAGRRNPLPPRRVTLSVMPKRSSIKRPTDFNQRALEIVKEATVEEPKKEPLEKNPHAVALGRLGGRKGGKARAEKLTPEERSEIARKAAKARWKGGDS